MRKKEKKEKSSSRLHTELVAFGGQRITSFFFDIQKNNGERKENRTKIIILTKELVTIREGGVE